MSQKYPTTLAGRYKKQFDAAVNDLYRKGDRSKPLLPEGAMEQKLTELKVRFADGLLQIEKEAKAQQQAADLLESRARQDLAHHLTDSELQTFEARQGIVATDAAKMDTLDYLRNARQAASSGNKPLALAHLRAMPEPQNFPEQREIDQVSTLLKGAIMPPDLLDAGKRAHQLRLDAEIERVAAKSALFDLSEEPASNFNPFD